MKIPILSLFLLIFSFINSTAQITFQKIFGGSGYDIFNNAALTSDSGYILVGLTDSMGAGNDDVYVVRTNAAGDTLWTAAYGGTTIESGQSVSETADGGFIIAGRTKPTTVSKYDIYVIKINATGDLLWSKSFGTAEDDYGYSIIETADSGYIIAGGTEINLLTPDIFLIRLNSSGDTLWTKIYHSPGWDIVYSIVESMDGGFILTGYTDFSGFGSSDILLYKTDSNGNILWSNAYGNSFHNYGWMVQQSADGGFVIAASSADSTGYYDFAFLKTDSTGNTEISKVYQCPGSNNQISSIVQKPDGGYVLGGFTYNSVTFNNGYLISLDSMGDPVWSKTYGSTNTDDVNAVLPATDNGFVLCGRKQGSGFGFYDGYMIRTDSSGNSGCLDSIIAVPALLPSLSQIPTNLTVMPFVPFITNPPVQTRRGTSVLNLCLVDGIEISKKSDFEIYPNPSSGQFTVTFDNLNNGGLLKVTNLMGEIILEMPVTHQVQIQVHLENAAPGIYFLTVQKNETQSSQKIIVNPR